MKLMERRRKTLEKTEASLVGMTVERLSSLNLTSEISTSLLSIPDAYACEKPMEKLKRDGGLDSAPQIPRKRCSGISIPESFPFSDIDNFALSGEFNIDEEDDDEDSSGDKNSMFKGCQNSSDRPPKMVLRTESLK
mmetsp:Transcript_14598/g.19060  ORF Transcript_14598/g.19060 Transcript_14598/m.19060 type:complete len:136 (-) Transcript_14598:151-558(-)|eukprot:CAMPEP_0198143342 /NCGR_PEP_ID=MMETSP1443-20131203/6571_1 /TAXON_ID=186043 /ORGANISM="Entomoneis sp., Strain CCMP2396" /LENGTH=135 /DNA_ID=CAMNT_0043806565 /DNA_START=62 /DNA_END=469 /DNA_ORIENTATION=+